MTELSVDTVRRIASTIASEIGAQPQQVNAAVELLDEGATVPFIARYRKERTGGLDDTQLRDLETRLGYLRELEERRIAVLASIDEQGKLDDALRRDIEAADSKARLEDLYRPFKPKRRTRAQIAREAGLEPLADSLLEDPTQTPESVAEQYLNAEAGFEDATKVLEGARAILMERWSEQADLVGELRGWLQGQGRLRSRVLDEKHAEAQRFADYFDHVEPLARVPSHRVLAMLRGRREEVLALELDPGDDADTGHQEAISRVASHAGVSDKGRAADSWLMAAARLCWKARLHTQLTLDLLQSVRERAESDAIRVFGDNLKDLLLAAPAGPKVVMGLDPALRTGVKVAIVDATGKLLATDTLYPHAPQRQWDAALASLEKHCRQHGVSLISIGNGTGSRETDRLVAELIKTHKDLGLQKIMVNEAGASVYSASALAAREFPNLDVSLRGAVSIARRLQDPLAELVKIEPKSIGVGQYQHDVNQTELNRALDARVEDCVNAVGVDLNTASAPLLSRVAGLSSTVAERVVQHRDSHGAFSDRKQLLKVERLGGKTFEQCAGFLRIREGKQPLDASAVHPEAYPVVEKIVSATGKDIHSLIGDAKALRALNANDFVDERFGLPTVQDILRELEKPGRDPRPAFKAAAFAEGVETMKDLREGMVLEGVISNVTDFGAFVDIGVHQDGLVHISQLADRFVKDPREVVKAGDIVKVKVLEVDLDRKRIALTRRLEEKAEPKAPSQREAPKRNQRAPKPRQQAPAPANAMAEALARAKRR
jgi:uncharacterized protein